MKRLFLQYLMLASAVAYGAAAGNLCNSGEIGANTDIGFTTPGSDNYVTKCNIKDRVYIQFTGADGPTTRLAPITMRFEENTVGEDVRVLIIGKTQYSETLAEATAYKFVVRNNAFGPGGMVYVRGVFPPSTSITISNNNFTIANPLVNLFPEMSTNVENMISAVYLRDVGLLEDVNLSVDSNRVAGNSTNGFVSVNAINFGADIYMYGEGSRIGVTNNEIDILCNATSAFGTAIGGDKTIYVYAKHTRFAIESNVIRSTGSSSVIRHPSVIAANGGSGYTTVVNNTITANTQGMAAVDATTGYRPVVALGSFSVEDHEVNTWVSNNDVTVTGPLASVGFSDSVVCGSGCAIYVAENKLTATGGNPAVHFQQRVDVRGTGALWINANELDRTDGASTGAPVHFANDVRLIDTASISVVNNDFDATSPTKMVEFGAAGRFNPAPASTSHVYLCNNRFGGAVLSTADEIKAATSTDIGNLAVVGACPATTQTTTTAVPTTTEATTENATTTTDASVAPTTTTSATVPQSTTTEFRNQAGAAASAIAALLATTLAAAAALL